MKNVWKRELKKEQMKSAKYLGYPPCVAFNIVVTSPKRDQKCDYNCMHKGQQVMGITYHYNPHVLCLQIGNYPPL